MLDHLTDAQLRHTLRAIAGPDGSVPEEYRRLAPDIAERMADEAHAIRLELVRRGADVAGREESCSSASRPAVILAGQGRTHQEAVESAALMLGGLLGMGIFACAWFVVSVSL